MAGLDEKIWNAKRLRIAVDAAGVGLWSWHVDTNAISLDDYSLSLWGIAGGTPLTFADLSARIVPPDLDRVKDAFAATRSIQGVYQIDFRILHDDGIRGVSARGRGADEGIVGREMFGIFLDTTEHMQIKKDQELLAAEMSHRVKNLFAITSSLTFFAARSASTTTEMADDLMQRLASLGRAHDLIRPQPGEARPQTVLLGDLFAILLGPYGEKGTTSDRIRVSVPELRIGENAAMTIALIVPELATNSVKYGALSVASGMLHLSCSSQNDEIVIVWTEKGGPPVAAPTGEEGFGSKLIARSIGQQFGGSVSYEWSLEGLIVTIRVLKERLIS